MHHGSYRYWRYLTETEQTVATERMWRNRTRQLLRQERNRHIMKGNIIPLERMRPNVFTKDENGNWKL